MGSNQLPTPDSSVSDFDFVQAHSQPVQMPNRNRENIGDVSAKSFAELLSGAMVDIYVGEERRRWTLHRNLLSYHAPFFTEDQPINGEHKKSDDGKIELPDEDATAFELLVKWLYQGKIEDVSMMPMDQKWEYAYTCQKLYLFCDRVGLQELKNVAIDQFRKGCNEAGLVPGPEEMKPIYEKTQASSPFRKLVSRIAARQIMDPAGNKDATTYRSCFEVSPDFAIDVIKAIKDGAGSALFDDPTEGNSCRYHEHDNGETCHKTVKFKDVKKHHSSLPAPATPVFSTPVEKRPKSLEVSPEVSPG